MSAESREWGKYYQCPRRQADQIPIPVLGKWGYLILRSKKNTPGRISSWPFRAEVAAGLSWDDLRNAPLPTLVLMGGCLVGFAEKKRGEV